MSTISQEAMRRAQVLSDEIAALVQTFTDETGIVVIGKIWPEKVDEVDGRVRFSYQVGLNLPSDQAVKI